jgi:putative oxidoreductase
MFRYLRQPPLDLAKAILRITLGFTFFGHGYIKLYQTYYGQTWTDVLSPTMQLTVGWSETICGILLAVGLLSRLAALVLIADQIGAIVLVTGRQDFIPVSVGPHGNTFKIGYEYNIMILAVCATLILVGSGWFSLDHLFFSRFRRGKTAQPLPASPPLRAEEEVARPVHAGQG